MKKGKRKEEDEGGRENVGCHGDGKFDRNMTTNERGEALLYKALLVAFERELMLTKGVDHSTRYGPIYNYV